MIKRLRSDWPFPAARAPFFYGWMILLTSTLGFLVSIPGQTMGMAAYTDRFIDDYDVTRTELATAYLFGTMISGFFLVRAGKFYDEFGARTAMVASSIFLGLFVVLIANIDFVLNELPAIGAGSRNTVMLILLTLAFTGVRFFGQGLLTSASRNVLLVWFEKRRGLITGVRSATVTLAYSAAPLALASINEILGWKNALLAIALGVTIGFSCWCLIFVRDHPSVCGLRSDGDTPEVLASSIEKHSVTLSSARSTMVFWLYALTLALYSFFSTAVIFHVSSIFVDASRSAADGFSFFLPVAAVATIVNLGVSWLSDKVQLKPLLFVMLTSLLISCIGFLFLDTDAGHWLTIFAYGTGSGLWGLISSVSFVRLFGAKHLGAISGLNASVSVFASAAGPFVFGYFYDFFGGYEAPFVVSGCMSTALALLLLVNSHKEVEPSCA